VVVGDELDDVNESVHEYLLMSLMSRAAMRPTIVALVNPTMKPNRK
jgi:hypothetical protein